MAADWQTFISEVSDKLTSQSIQSYEEMADFLRNQYIKATVGKAASPFGQLHKKGKDKVMFDGFKKGFKILYEGGDLSFEDKKTSPEYADLDVQPPVIDTSGAVDQVDIDFRTWTEENESTIPDFTYSQFFSQYPKFPADRTQAVIEIARKILHQFDGTGSYLQWMYSLRTGAYSDWGNLIMDQVVKLVKSEVDRPLQIGDSVRGYAKYRNVDTIYFFKTTSGGVNSSSYTSTEPAVSQTGYGSYNNTTSMGLKDAFNLIKGDVNIDNTKSYSDTYNRRNSRSNGDEVDGQWSGDLLDGKIASITSGKIKVSYFSKQYNRTLIKELIPGTVNRKLDVKVVAANLPSVLLSDKLLQEQHYMNPGKIPDYLTSQFITTFTYSPRYDTKYLRALLNTRSSLLSQDTIKSIESEFEDSYQYADEIVNLFSNNLRKSGFLARNTNYFGTSNSGFGTSYSNFSFNWIKQQREANKRSEYASEEERYRNLRIRWINEIADAARKNEDPDKPEDGYFVMAKGVIDYWKSCNVQPLSKEPGAPPCLFSPPQGGIYSPIYYGSQTMLGSNIKRAFNTGKRFNGPAEKQIAAKMVASALAYSFSMHMLELKFIYKGGIPGPNGPIPMIGFVPLVY
jgi:hypothetical protein